MSSNLIKVADVDELPPGKGKTMNVAGREVTVYNREGRYVATATSPRAAAPSETRSALETTCEMPGRHFEVGPAMSPDRLQSDELRYQVVVDDGNVYVVVEI
jgi:nitrite reductase/ring-hydroxylating ferredoxin subunit